MKVIIVLCFAVLTVAGTAAQSQQQNNTAMDSLKRSVKQLGNLFKKAVPLPVTVLGIDSADRNLTVLLNQLQQSAGIKKIKTTYADTSIVVLVPYKGQGKDLWQNLPANAHQLFSVVQAGDTTLTLRYKYARKPLASTSTKVPGNATVPGNANLPPASKGMNAAAALLFKDVRSTLSVAEKNLIVTDMQFLVAKDGKSFYHQEAPEFPFSASAYPTDLNGDGKEEIFILFGNTYTSGMTGSSIALYIPGKSGKLEANLGFPGTLPYAFATTNLGYPDLMIGGPGFEFPIWRWNGKAYGFYKKIKENDWLKLKYTQIEDVSKKYQASLK